MHPLKKKTGIKFKKQAFLHLQYNKILVWPPLNPLDLKGYSVYAQFPEQPLGMRINTSILEEFSGQG